MPQDTRIQALEAPAIPTHHVNFIHRGSEVCGLTYSATKTISRESKLQAPMRPRVEVVAITFDESDLDPLHGPHHDGLVIKMQIGWATVSRVLVDGGSAVNIVMMSALEVMGIGWDKVGRKSSKRAGLSGGSEN